MILQGVEGGIFPTKKVKVKVKPHTMLSHSSTLTFLLGNLSSSKLGTFWGGTSQKNCPYVLNFQHLMF